MRVILYGAASVAVLAACAEMAQAARARPVWRNDQFFKPEETEPCEAVVCVDGAEQSEAIIAAYTALEVPVVVVPEDVEIFAESGVREQFGALLTRGTPLSVTPSGGGADDLSVTVDVGGVDELQKTIDVAEGVIAELKADRDHLLTVTKEQAGTIAVQAEQLDAKDAVIAEQAAAIAALEARLASALASTGPGAEGEPASDTPPASEPPAEPPASTATSTRRTSGRK